MTRVATATHATSAEVLMEGFLRKGGGKSGTKKGKPSFFRMRSHMIVYYDGKLEDGMPYKGKPKGDIPRDIVLFAESLDAQRMAEYKVKSDLPNTLVVVCTSRLYRLVAESADQRDMWVAGINEHLVDCENEIKKLKLTKLRVTDVLNGMGKTLKMGKGIFRTVQMVRYLEDEVMENHRVSKVLEEVELPKAEGKASDLKASTLTKTAYDRMVLVMECMRSNFDIDQMVASYTELGIEPHTPDPPSIQLSFKAEYNRCVDLMFKDDPAAKALRGAEVAYGADNEDDVDDEDLFVSDLIHEEMISIDHSIKGKSKKSMMVKLYNDHFAWHALDSKGRMGNKPAGSASLRVILHCDTIQPKVLRIVNFDEKESFYCFFKTDAAMEKFIDEISHTILDYNKSDPTSIKGFYDEKETQIRDGMKECRAAVKKAGKGIGVQLWQMMMIFVDGYADDLFVRLKETRVAGNERRLHIGTNNPHLATRRVAADLDAAINTMSMVRASIVTAPVLPDHLVELESRQTAAQRLLDMMTEDNLARLKDIDDMLENELAEEEDTAVSAMLMKGYGHDEGEAGDGSPEANLDDDDVDSDYSEEDDD
eukprot:COSAG06_NODE_3193_length_5704_cov_6.627119_2_plen_593_part_00